MLDGGQGGNGQTGQNTADNNNFASNNGFDSINNSFNNTEELPTIQQGSGEDISVEDIPF